MFKRSTPTTAILGISFLSIAILSGCATTQNKQSAAPTPDANVQEIVKQVKQQPSTISGGGMIYELFVGNRFSARYSDTSKELKLTDFSNNDTCEYDATGVLKVPANAKADFQRHCASLSSDAIDYLKH